MIPGCLQAINPYFSSQRVFWTANDRAAALATDRHGHVRTFVVEPRGAIQHSNQTPGRSTVGKPSELG